MKIIEAALRELKEALYVLDIVALLLDTIITFLGFLIFLVIFNLPWYYALAPAILYFTFTFLREWNHSKMSRVEEKVPELNEQLRTVEDNLDKENTITTWLNDEVIAKMKKIKTSFFIDLNDLKLKSASILLISLIIIIIAILNVNFDAKLAAQKINAKGIFTRQPLQEVTRIDLASLREGNLSDIFGNKSLAKLGTKELELTLNPLQSEINLQELTEAEKQTFTPPDFPKEIYTSYEQAYTENVPKENQKVIQRYFQQITQ